MSGEARLVHQPALDGLRGFAVIAVILFHQPFGARWFPGGFLGVDIFFVLSGYLITSLLLVDFARSGRVISVNFWARRARRLLPALAVFFLLVAVYARWFAYPYEHADLRAGALAAALYGFNWWSQYLAGHHPVQIYTHLWSLSIEEQFYIVWPFLLAATLWIARGRRRAMVIGVGVLIAFSVVAMWTRYSWEGRSFAYLATDGRAHELLVGAALAFVARDGWEARSRWWSLVGVGALAALGVMIGTASIQSAWLYEGGYLIVALLVAAVIAGSSAGPVFWVLSWRPLCAVGLISYGLYLFHVPLDAMLDASHTGLNGAALFAVRVTAVTALAVLSYFVVERPIRSQRVRPALLAVGAGGVVIVVAGATLHSPPPTASQRLDAQFQLFASTVPSGATRVLLVGDQFVASIGSAVHGHIAGLAVSGCGIDDAPTTVGRVVVPRTSCSEDTDRAVRLAFDDFQPTVAVLALGPSVTYDVLVDGRRLPAGSSQLEAHLDRVLDLERARLTSRGARFILATAPCFSTPSGGPFQTSTAVLDDATRARWLRGVRTRYTRSRHVPIADIDSVLCSDGQRVAYHGIPLTAPDGIGVSRFGARAVWNVIARALEPTQS